jgi:ABC-2 type transport system permease protein
MRDFLPLLLAISVKEFKQMSRDRLTLGLLLAIPFLQLMLSGYALTHHPKALPTAVVSNNESILLTHTIKEMEATGYFHVITQLTDASSAEQLMQQNNTQFTLLWPDNAAEYSLKHEPVPIKVIADVTDPISSSAALNSLNKHFSINDENSVSCPDVSLNIERKFNDDSNSALHIVPGLLGVILTLTLILLASLSIVREVEHGTWEGLITSPLPALAVLLGKILPYFILGVLQTVFILTLAILFFDIPWLGSVAGLLFAIVLFILANLGLGMIFSLLSKNQMQAMLMGLFFYLPSILLSGFMFPFYGMPRWAQWLGEAMPLTHFLRIVHGALLKGAGDQIVMLLSWPIALFALLSFSLALMLFRHKL